MNFQNLLAALHIWSIDLNLAVKAARAQKGRVQNVGPVGGGNHDDVGFRVKPVHFDQELIQGLLPLVVTPTHAGAAVAAHSIDFVHENNGG